MCGLDVYFTIRDKESNTIVEFQSSEQFNANEICQITTQAKIGGKEDFKSNRKKDYYEFITKQQKQYNKNNGTWFGPNSSEQSSSHKLSKRSKSLDQIIETQAKEMQIIDQNRGDLNQDALMSDIMLQNSQLRRDAHFDKSLDKIQGQTQV